MSAPLPEPTPVSQPFWDALRENRILIQYSPSLQRYVFYPRTLAPGMLDERTGKTVDPNYANWTTHPNNPMARQAAE